ncbi:hypothetical protein [Bacillus benzoevorans]|uniref:Uncharacterized protein n=1 Tax=Bacillus benzoevorans TaxID=1456 RepID=A0A7X0LVA7_9BACI|nr:hypothetical protein [Bacillus benzoevorans]
MQTCIDYQKKPYNNRNTTTVLQQKAERPPLLNKHGDGNAGLINGSSSTLIYSFYN